MAQREVHKKVKNAVWFKDGTIRIDNVRGSYVHLDKPYKGKPKPGDNPDNVAKFSITGILMKDTHVEAKNLILERIEEILADNKNAKVAKDKRFIRNGDDAEKEEYENAWTVNAREERNPKCRSAGGTLITDPAEIRQMFQSGYWFNILIRPWFQDNDYGKRVNAGLVGVQFVKKDKTFGEGEIDDTDAWEAVEGGGESSDLDDDGL